jgi:type I restriction enzyme S subunit
MGTSLPDNWKVLTVDKIKAPTDGAIAIGPFGSRMKANVYVNQGIPVIRGTNISDTKEFTGEFVYISEEMAKSLKSSNVYNGDLVFPHRGSIGEVGIVTGGKDAHYILSSSLMKLTPNCEIADSLFLFYYFRSDIGKHELLKNASQVGTPGIQTPLTSLKSLDVYIPPISEQRGIAGILGALDDKIELNRRMNRTLESFARALFHQWFVESEETSNWVIGKLGNFCEPTIGGDWGEEQEFEESVPVICLRGVDLDNLRKDGYSEDAPLRWVKKLSLEKRQLSDCDILIAGSGIGPVGKPLWVSPEMLAAYQYPVIYSNFVKRFRAQSPEYAVYVDRVLFNMRESNEIWDYVNGTSIPNLDDKGLLDYSQVVVPAEDKVKAFYEYVKPIYAKLYNKESRTLASLRDTLLPKLMRGEVRVKDV